MTTSFDALKSDLKAYFADTSNDLDSSLPSLINQAEQRLGRDIRGRGQLVQLSATMTGETHEFDDNHVAVVSAHVLSSGSYYILEQRSAAFLRDWRGSSAGRPEYFGYIGRKTIRILPQVVSGEVLRFNNFVRPSPLASGNQSNYWTDEFPDVLFSAAKVYAARRLAEPGETADRLEAEYQTLLQGVSRMEGSAMTDARMFGAG